MALLQVLFRKWLKALAEDKFIGAQIIQVNCDMAEDTVGNGVNADYKHFLLFPQCLPKASFPGL